jgi:hypothetical protein
VGMSFVAMPRKNYVSNISIGGGHAVVNRGSAKNGGRELEKINPKKI